jgi:hypothetical protein
MDLPKHVLRANGFPVVVFQALAFASVADGVKRGAAKFACSLGNIVRHIEYLFGVLIEQKVVIAEVAPSHVPVKILGLDIERECVGEQGPQFGRDFRDTFAEDRRAPKVELFTPEFLDAVRTRTRLSRVDIKPKRAVELGMYSMSGRSAAW